MQRMAFREGRRTPAAQSGYQTLRPTIQSHDAGGDPQRWQSAQVSASQDGALICRDRVFHPVLGVRQSPFCPPIVANRAKKRFLGAPPGILRPLGQVIATVIVHGYATLCAGRALCAVIDCVTARSLAPDH
jgi:hypothetical protein